MTESEIKNKTWFTVERLPDVVSDAGGINEFKFIVMQEPFTNYAYSYTNINAEELEKDSTITFEVKYYQEMSEPEKVEFEKITSNILEYLLKLDDEEEGEPSDTESS